MTALFIVLFLNQWMKEESHHSSLIGLTISEICIILFGSDGFIIPAMVLILLILPLFRKAFVKAGVVR